MAQTLAPGQIIILKGAPRSGKSSIVEVIQNTFDGVWMNLGVDRFMQMTPRAICPGWGCDLFAVEGTKTNKRGGR